MGVPGHQGDTWTELLHPGDKHIGISVLRFFGAWPYLVTDALTTWFNLIAQSCLLSFDTFIIKLV